MHGRSDSQFSVRHFAIPFPLPGSLSLWITPLSSLSTTGYHHTPSAINAASIYCGVYVGPLAVGVDVDPSGIQSALVFQAGSLLCILWAKTLILTLTVIAVCQDI